KTESRTVTMIPVGQDEKGRSSSAPWTPQAKVASTADPSLGGAAQGSPEHPAPEAPSPMSSASAAAAPTTSALATPMAPPPSAPAAGPPGASAAAAPTPTVLAYGPDMSQPRLLYSVDPVFPREAVVAKIEGTVIAKCTITTSGSLESCRIIKGLPFMDR